MRIFFYYASIPRACWFLERLTYFYSIQPAGVYEYFLFFGVLYTGHKVFFFIMFKTFSEVNLGIYIIMIVRFIS